MTGSASPTPAFDRPLGLAEVDEIRRSRRRPRLTQFDYLHLRCLLDDLEYALGLAGHAPLDALDVYCGTRPYEDLLPAGSRCIGLDVTNRYHVADHVTAELLPFDDASFDLVMCVQGFHYVRDPEAALHEFWRVLRPGGRVVITVPGVWEYEREQLEYRYTGPLLSELLSGWNDRELRESGGRAVVWTTLTCQLLELVRGRVHSPMLSVLADSLAKSIYRLFNLLGLCMHRAEMRWSTRPQALPMNLMITARRSPEPK